MLCKIAKSFLKLKLFAKDWLPKEKETQWDLLGSEETPVVVKKLTKFAKIGITKSPISYTVFILSLYLSPFPPPL